MALECHDQKGNLYYQGRQFKMFFFSPSELCPFFYLNFLYSIKHPTAKCWPQFLAIKTFEPINVLNF